MLHGYQRPGWGYVVGQCFGLKYPPFELSCEGTKALKVFLEERVVSETEYLRKLEAGEITTLSSRMTNREPMTSASAGWKMRLDSEISQTKSTLRSLKKDIETLTKLIADWSRPPSPKKARSLSPGNDSRWLIPGAL